MPREVAQRQLANAKAKVGKLASEKRLSVKDAIRDLYEDVTAAITQSGREATEVYSVVAQALDISDETVKAYYNDIRREREAEENKGRTEKVTPIRSRRHGNRA